MPERAELPVRGIWRTIVAPPRGAAPAAFGAGGGTGACGMTGVGTGAVSGSSRKTTFPNVTSSPGTTTDVVIWTPFT